MDNSSLLDGDADQDLKHSIIASHVLNQMPALLSAPQYEALLDIIFDRTHQVIFEATGGNSDPEWTWGQWENGILSTFYLECGEIPCIVELHHQIAVAYELDLVTALCDISVLMAASATRAVTQTGSLAAYTKKRNNGL